MNLPSKREVEAAIEYMKRQMHTARPDGQTDTRRCFSPSPGEHRQCCDRIGAPSRRFPYSYWSHCCTARHVANLYGVNQAVIKSLAKMIRNHCIPLTVEAVYSLLSAINARQQLQRLTASLPNTNCQQDV